MIAKIAIFASFLTLINYFITRVQKY